MSNEADVEKKVVIDATIQQRDYHLQMKEKTGGIEEVLHGLVASLLTWMLDEFEPLVILTEVIAHDNWLVVETNVPLSTGIPNVAFMQLTITEDDTTPRDTTIDAIKIIDDMQVDMTEGLAKDMMVTHLAAVGFTGGSIRGLCYKEPEEKIVEGDITELVWRSGEHRYQMKINAVDLRRYITQYSDYLESQESIH